MARRGAAVAEEPLLPSSGIVGIGPIEGINWRTWLVQVFCFALTTSVLFITLVTASLPQTGYPCFYGSLVDYTQKNHSVVDGVWMRQIAGGVAPTLFLETTSLVAFLYYTTLVLVAISFYLIISAVLVRRYARGKECTAVAGCTRPTTTLIASHVTPVLGTLATWLLQVVILLLSHKQAVLGAAVYVVHFVSLVFFCMSFSGLGTASAQYSSNLRILKTNLPALHKMAGPGRAVMTNLGMGMLGISLPILSLMLGIILANSFHITLWQTVTVAVGVFVALGLMFLIIVELIVSHYVHVLVGPALAVLVASSTLAVATHSYFVHFHAMVSVQAPNLATASKAIVGIMAVISIIMLVVRLVRAIMFHKKRNTEFYGRVKTVSSKARRYVNKVRGPRRNPQPLNVAESRGMLLAEDSETDAEEPIYDVVSEEFETEYYDDPQRVPERSHRREYR
nr:envelope glycoprotein M [Equid alphaherpesvirus 1]